MSKVTSIFSSSYYKQKWQEAEEQYAKDVQLAGVKSTGDGNSDVEFLSDRLKALRENIDYYKSEYEKAYNSENGNSKYKRMKTSMWGY